jgi:pyrroloquinoline-quinone synthase
MFGGEIQGVGALGIGTEGIVAVMYRKILRGIAIAWPNLAPRDRVFFDLHAVVDDDHAHTLRDIAIQFADTPETKRELAVGVYRALAIRNAFFDEMMAEIDAKVTTTTHPAVNVAALGLGAKGAEGDPKPQMMNQGALA